MGKKAKQEICRVCGEQAKKFTYYSQSRGKSYRYFRFIHQNGVTHYYRVQMASADKDNETPAQTRSVFDNLEDIVNTKMREKELRFGEIKSLIEDSYGKPVSVATMYRNINKLLKLELIGKRIDAGVVLYKRRIEATQMQEMQTSSMTIGLDFSRERISVTIFIHIKNNGLRLITGVPISIPVGEMNSLNGIDLRVYDGTKRITMGKENIAYSYPGRTGISIGLNRPLRKSEEEDIFLNYSYKFSDQRVKINILSDVDLLKIKCEVSKEKSVEIKKILVDGLKEVGSETIRRSGAQLGRTVVEAEFENASRGDTIVISLGR
jgi:hypothetical protein